MIPPAMAPRFLPVPMRFFLLSAILFIALSVPSWSAPLPDHKSISKIAWKHGAIHAGDRFAGLTREEWTEYFASRPRQILPDSATRDVDETVVARRLGLAPSLVRKVRTERSVDYRRMLEFSPPLLARVFWRTHHPKRPDHPGEAAAFRALQQRSEDGQIVENGLANAARQLEEMQENVRAGISPSFPGDPVPGEGPEVAGIDSTRWQALGPGNVPGRIRSAIIFPDSNIKVIGSVGGGIFRTTNGGQSWTAVNDFLANLAIGCMAQSPLQRDTIYAGTGEGFYNSDRIRGDGIFKSTDSGQTWTQLSATASNSSYRYVNRIAIDPGNVNILLAGTQTGIFRSTNAGASWSATAGAGEAMDVDFHPNNASFAVASGRNGNTWYSTDGGQNWTAATGIPSEANNRVEVAYAPSNGGVVYASCQRNSGELYRSTDSGVTYSLQNTGSSYLGSQGWYDNCLWVDPVNPDHVATGGIDVWRSTNAGANLTQISDWSQNSSGLSAHADHHILLSHPDYNGTTNREFYTGSDGGLAFTNDITTVAQTSGWTLLRNNIVTTQAYGGAGNPAGVFWLGTQDNGTPAYFGDSNAWTRHSSRSGDGGHCAADQLDANYLYGEYVYLTIYRSSNGGATATDIYSGITDADNSATAFFIAPFILDPNDQGRMYAGGVQLWRTSDVKATPPTWSSVKASNGNKISAIAVAPGNPNVIWVATSNSTITGANASEVFYTANGLEVSPTWTQVDGNGVTLPNRYCSRIAIDPRNPAHVYVTFGGYNTNNLYVTSDTGTTWTNVNATANPALPTAPIRTVVFGNYSSDSVYVGTEVGIFASANAGAAWSPSQDGPANVSVDQLFWVGADTLHAATHGRGLWRISVPRPDTTTPPPIDTTGPNVWYVNDTSTTGDSFTSGFGSDANSGVSRTAPKRTIAAVCAFLTTGDTVYIDAGTFGETMVAGSCTAVAIIDTMNVTLVGVDSLVTLLDPGDSSSGSNIRGIYADTISGLTIRNLRVSNARTGIEWYNVDTSTMASVDMVRNSAYGLLLFGGSESILVSTCGGSNNAQGIRILSSSRNTIRENVLESAAGAGISNEGSSNNAFIGNTARLNNEEGIFLTGSSGNSITGNVLAANGSDGVYLTSNSNGNRIEGNHIAANLQGILIDGSSGNVVAQNELSANTTYQIQLGIGASADTIERNNITTSSGKPESGVQNQTIARFDATRNWWGTADSATIRARIRGTGRDSVVSVPFRLGRVDTRPGFDTLAPRAPDTVAASDLSDTSVRVTWSTVGLNEDGSAGNGDLAGYRVYQSSSPDSTSWILRGTVSTATRTYDDSGLARMATYFYRVTAFDNASFENQSFFTDSIIGVVPGAIDSTGANVWYVNDSSTSGDSFTSAVGLVANHGLLPSAPKRGLAGVIPYLTAGDTVYIDAGTFQDSNLVLSVSDVIVEGKDSLATIVDANYETCFILRGAHRSIFRKVQIVNANYPGGLGQDHGAAIRLENSDSVVIASDSFLQNTWGVNLALGSDSATVTNCVFNPQTQFAVYVESGPQAVITGNTMISFGIGIENRSDSGIVAGNTMTNTVVNVTSSDSIRILGNSFSNVTITLTTAQRCDIESNTITTGGIVLNDDVLLCRLNGNSVTAVGATCFDIAGDTNTLINNFAFGSGVSGQGFWLKTAAAGNILTSNTASAKRNFGYLVQGTSNILDANLAVSCQDGGYRISGDTNVLNANTARTITAGAGFVVEGRNNVLRGNHASACSDSGFHLNGAVDNILSANHADSNLGYALAIVGSSSGNTVRKNSFVTSPTRPDSGVLLVSVAAVDLTRSWWNTTDSASIRNRIRGAGVVLAMYTPFRFGVIDTGYGADTVAPDSPVNLIVDTPAGQIRISWTAPSVNEGGTGGATGIAKYHIYRSRAADTTDWIGPIGETTATVYSDTRIATDTIYYYRVTAEDSASYPNRGFYSAIVSGSVPRVFADFSGDST
ncbi:MAG: NosD domain-containing protein, partial [Candidatus Hydrogenedentota bacterium]